MSLPAPNTLAVVGAGPIGIEAALAAVDRGFDVHLFERGEPGAHAIAWGHIRMFTPWRMNLGPTTTRHLAAAGWTAPDPDAFPTGSELASRYLAPAAALEALKGRVHTSAQVIHISRRGTLKGDLIGNPARREQPFRLMVRDAGGRESYLHAFSVIDASGVYGQPNWAGDGGIPARQELYVAPQLAYHPEDVTGLARARYAGKRTLVVGAGASAMTTIAALADLDDEAPGTTALWATRATAAEVARGVDGDPLPARAALHARARALAGGAHPAITHLGAAAVEGFEFNSATHRYRVSLRAGEAMRLEEVDQVIVNTGFGPDHSLYRELQIHECYASRGLMNLAAALLGAGTSDCLSAPALGADVLASPEPDFFVLGHKAYGRSPHFLLETGYGQVHSALDSLARARLQGTATRA